LQVTFVGPPPEFQPLKSALDHVLRQHEATVKATLFAAFEPVLDLSGEAFADLERRATDTGPSKAAISIITEAQ
jgi:hypothetical protein